jgi:hypothetical protein
MASNVLDLLRAWHDFYVLVGTASATLVGLMFIAASVGAQIFKEENRGAMEAFISPTVVHFSTTLFVSILATVPVSSGLPLAALFLTLGLAGFAFSLRVWFQLLVRRSYKVDLIDRVFYALIPCVGQLLVPVAGATLLVRPALGLDCLAGATIVLLFAGIRNAWDMTMWIVIRIPVGESRDDPPR